MSKSDNSLVQFWSILFHARVLQILDLHISEGLLSVKINQCVFSTING